MGTRAAIFVATFAAATAACGTLLGVSADDAPPPAPPALDGGGSDSPSGDDPEGDAFVGVDSGDDANADADATAGPTFCSMGTYDFCADFDVFALSGGWDSLVNLNGELALDVTASRSAPRSLAVRFPGTAAGSYLTRTVAKVAFPTITVAWQMRFDQLEAADAFGFLRVDAAGTRFSVIADTENPTSALELGYSGSLHPQAAIPADAIFHPLVLRIDLMMKQATLTVDGVGGTPVVLSGLPTSETTVTLTVGAIGSVANMGMTSVHLDDITVLLQ